MKFKVQRGQVMVTARSSVHDTTTRYPKIAGTIDFDPDAPTGAHAEITVDMRIFDAGDKLTNWKLKSDLDADAHPTATFTLARLDQANELTAGQFTAAGVGQLSWRGRAATVKVRGKATVDRRSIDATASFELNVSELGVTPPSFLMVKVADLVAVQVSLFAIVVADR